MKTFIKNGSGLKIAVKVEGGLESNKLAFVMHGLGGYKEQGHIRAMAEAFLENSYKVVTFDATNSFGESEGNYTNATTTNYYSDLKDVINWAEKQIWYVEPFALCGHSLGGISVALFAEENPSKVNMLAPIAPVVSGKLSFEAHDKKELEEWKNRGIREQTSWDGKRVKRLKWEHMEDRLKYNLLTKANLLKMPKLIVVGEKDTSTPPKHQQILYDKLPDPKEMHVINGALHSFYEEHERRELQSLISQWLKG